jgi:hypothetical protein
MTLSVAHPQRLGRLADGTRWIYADDDLAGYANTANEYGEARRLLDPAALQAAISRTTGAYLDWIDAVLADQPPHYWLAASYFKDVVCTPTLLHLACLRAASDGSAAGHEVIVVTRSAALATQIFALGGKRRSSAATWWPDALRQSAAAWAHWLVRPWQIWLRSLLASVGLGPAYRDKLKNIEILVDTFFFAEDLAPDGRYTDRFSPGLIDWYQTQGWRAASMPYTGHLPLRVMRGAYRRMRHSSTLFALGESFLGIADCLLGAWYALRALLQPPDFAAATFCGIQVSPLVSRWWRLSALQTVTSQIWKRVPRNMRRHGLQPDYVVDWYENQPLDKAICLGFGEDSAQTRVIAGRQYFPAASMVNYFSTRGEISAGAAPRLNWVCGRRGAALFARHDRLGRYEAVPALRYAHLFADTAPVAETRMLAVFLTSSLPESMCILECVFAADSSAWADFDFIAIKMHQSVDNQLRKQVEKRWPAITSARVGWDGRSAGDILNGARLAVTGGSSVALEAVCRGVPVIVSGRSAGISFNILEDVDRRLWRLAYSSREFEQLVCEWLPQLPDRSSRRETGRRIRDEHFEITTPATMQAFDPRRFDNIEQRAITNQS